MTEEIRAALDRLVTLIRGYQSPHERALAAHMAITAISQAGGVRRDLSTIRREAVNALRDEGHSLGDIAERLNISRGTVQQISEGRSSGRVRVPGRQPVIIPRRMGPPPDDAVPAR